MEGVCEDIMKVLEGLCASADKAENKGEARSDGQGGAPMYAAVFNIQLLAAHLSNLARAQVRDWLVLINKDPAAKKK